MAQLIVGIDFPEKDRIEKLVGELGELVEFYKIGSIVFSKHGPGIVEWLKEKGKKIFLDLKLFDIPNTVKETVKVISEMAVDFCSLHLLGGEEMVKAAVEGKNRAHPEMKLVGVTILTSMNEDGLKTIGIEKEIRSAVLNLAEKGKEWGIDGLVCSGEELPVLRKRFLSPFFLVCPGIRRETMHDDQKRIIRPAEAVKQGADFLVIGRPIYLSKHPREIVLAILQEMSQ